MKSILEAIWTNNWSNVSEASASVALEPLELTTMEQQVVIARMKKLAKDPACTFANALDLVHRSYQKQEWERQHTIGELARPSYTNKKAWKQYEEFIELAVRLLSKYRGVNGDWRTNAFASVPTNDRASMGSMMAAKVGESATITWKSSEHLQMVAEQYDPTTSIFQINCIFPSIEQALDVLIAECEKKQVVICHVMEALDKEPIVYQYDILDKKTAEIIDTVFIQTI